MSPPCVVILAFQAATTVEGVLDRVPAEVCGRTPVLLVADDASTDDTVSRARSWSERTGRPLEVLVQTTNRGYGGNQKAAYRWARERGHDIVVLVHADAQYPPEHLERLVAPLLDGRADAAFGSRLMQPGGARAGGMPWIRLLANRGLTTYLNAVSGGHLTEWFSGYRAYRMATLEAARFETLPDGFDFDSEIILRILDDGGHIVEAAMPTHYGDEISRVPLVRTGLMALVHGARHLRTRRGGAQRNG